MISRLSTFATVFAIATTAALAFTVHAQQQQQPQPVVARMTTLAKPVRIVELPRVVVVAHRLERSSAP